MLEQDSWAACREDHKESFEYFWTIWWKRPISRPATGLFLKTCVYSKDSQGRDNNFIRLKRLYLEDKSSLLEQANICWRLVFGPRNVEGINGNISCSYNNILTKFFCPESLLFKSNRCYLLKIYLTTNVNALQMKNSL